MYNCQVRVRLSKGLRIKAYYGTFHQRNPTDLEFGLLHADNAFSVEFEHSSRHAMDEREYAHLQCAALYTTVDGLRRVRVMNVAFQVSALAGNVFRYADVEATVCHLVKEGRFCMCFLMSYISTDKPHHFQRYLHCRHTIYHLFARGLRRNAQVFSSPIAGTVPLRHHLHRCACWSCFVTLSDTYK